MQVKESRIGKLILQQHQSVQCTPIMSSYINDVMGKRNDMQKKRLAIFFLRDVKFGKTCYLHH